MNMILYKFFLDTGEGTQKTEVHPIYDNDLGISYELENDERYYITSLNGKLTFVRNEYEYIMGKPFGIKFRLFIEISKDGGSTYTLMVQQQFSKPDCNVDEDNHIITVESYHSLEKYDELNNAKDTEVDLVSENTPITQIKFKVPNLLEIARASDTVGSAMFMSDNSINVFDVENEIGWDEKSNSLSVWSNAGFALKKVYAEAELKFYNTNAASGRYAGEIRIGSDPGLYGFIYSSNGYSCQIKPVVFSGTEQVLYYGNIKDANGNYVAYYVKSTYDIHQSVMIEAGDLVNPYVTSMTGFRIKGLTESGAPTNSNIGEINIYIHYIYARIIQKGWLNIHDVNTDKLQPNANYKYARSFDGMPYGGFAITLNTTATPNDYGFIGNVGYFAPPDNSGRWHPFSSENWIYASIWYLPTFPAELGMAGWNIATGYKLGDAITSILNKLDIGVSFSNDSEHSHFLCDTTNPITGEEYNTIVIAQVSNLLVSNGASQAIKSVITLNNIIEFLRNAFNCFWYLDANNQLHIEHVKYFDNGRIYSGESNITDLRYYYARKGMKNLLYQTNKYSFDIDDSPEKLTFSWAQESSVVFDGYPIISKSVYSEKSKEENNSVSKFITNVTYVCTSVSSDKMDKSLFFAGVCKIPPTQPVIQDTHVSLIAAEVRSQGILTGYRCMKAWTVTGESIYQLSHIDFMLKFGYSMQIDTSWSGEHPGSITYTIAGTGVRERNHTINLNPYTYSVQITITSSTYPSDGNYGMIYAWLYDNIPVSTLEPQRVVENNSILYSGEMVQNEPLTFPRLHSNYFKYNLPFKVAEMNNDDANLVTAITMKRFKKQSLSLPVEVIDKYTNLFKTSLGNGIVRSMDVKLASLNAEIEMIYEPE